MPKYSVLLQPVPFLHQKVGEESQDRHNKRYPSDTKIQVDRGQAGASHANGYVALMQDVGQEEWSITIIFVVLGNNPTIERDNAGKTVQIKRPQAIGIRLRYYIYGSIEGLI